MSQKPESVLLKANTLFRERNYLKALSLYKEVKKSSPFLKNTVDFNIALTKKRINNNENYPSREKIAVIVHLFYEDIWKEIESRLSLIDYDFDLYVTIPFEVFEASKLEVYKKFPQAYIIPVSNIGMDIAPFLKVLGLLEKKNYLAACKIHTKKGEKKAGGVWRNTMLESLIGSTDVFEDVVHAFKNNDNLSLVGPAPLFKSAKALMYDNEEKVNKIIYEVFNHKRIEDDWGFFTGTMFWVRVEDYSLIADYYENYVVNQEFEYKKDGLIEHALERVLGLVPRLNNKDIGMLSPKSYLKTTSFSLDIVRNDYKPLRVSVKDTLTVLSNLNEYYLVIQDSGLFDEEYYLSQNKDLENKEIDLIYHYLTQGTFTEKYPNKYFIPREYRALNNDIIEANIEPFYHYLKYGAIENKRYRETPSRENPSFRYQVLNNSLINWRYQKEKARDEDLISIVIPIYGQSELTEKCLNSLLRSRTSRNIEIVCIDNGSKDTKLTKYLQYFVELDSRIRLVTNNENLNFSLGCNIGFYNTKGSKVIFLNNDTIVTDYWIDELVKPLDQDQDIVAVQPKLLFPDEKVQNIGIVFAKNQTLGYPIYCDFDKSEEFVGKSRNYQAVTAACIALRSKDFASVNGFDPLFINGQEDVDLCLRLTHGTYKKCYYQSSSVVYHFESKTPGRGKFIKQNRLNFVNRWKGVISADDYKYYADDGYKIINWIKDANEFRRLDIAANRPVLVKNENVTMFFNWDFSLEAHVIRSISKVYLDKFSTKEKPLVSIIMPTYNRGSIISIAINSVLQQSYGNFELIILDDGSIDDTKQVVSKFSDNRIRYVQLEHRGVSHARNEGLKIARGSFIAYLDTDNTWKKNFLTYMLTFMWQSKVDGAYSSIVSFNDEGEIIGYRGKSFNWDRCFQENYVDMNSLVHKKEIIENKKFDENLERMVDWDFLLNISIDRKFCHIPFVGVNYYEGESFDRITKTKFVGRHQEIIDKIHTRYRFFYRKKADLGMTYEIFFGLTKQRKNDLRPLVFRIKIGCPNLSQKEEWGDYHFSIALKKSLEKLGHECFIDCLDSWYSDCNADTDVVLVIRGLSQYKLNKSHVNLMWNISHPDKILLKEFEEYDHIFVASTYYAEKLKKKIKVPVTALLQCTDPDLFNPDVISEKYHEYLFVGNSRNVYRDVVEKCISNNLDLSVYGTRWEQFIPKTYIKGQNISNNSLGGYYAGANFVFNDHWKTMKDYGFLSNRLFDAVACGAKVVSDEIEGLDDVFDGYVKQYSSDTPITNLVSESVKWNSFEERKEFGYEIGRLHNFDSRAAEILSYSEKIIRIKSNPIYR